MKTLPTALKNSFLPHCLAGAGGCLLVLVIQNLLIFWQHYIGTASFNNDFISIYYPMTAFWTTLVRHGVFPEWMPFENMGFPFVLTMQSGIFYPPLWLFTLSEQLPYTLHAAAIVQALHVGFGAIGCWLYARLLGRSHGAALFAAMAFQFFGGFYSNSEHVDIVRAFAYIPWLFWAVQLLPTQTTANGRNLCTPLILWFFITGAYQANVISHFFLLVIFVVLSFCASYSQHSNRDKVIKIYLQVSGLILLGILLSSICLFPTLALKTSLLRGEVWTGMTMSWPWNFWDSLVMPSDAEGLYVMKSMVSAFITVPVFCLLFFISRDSLKQHRVWVCVIVISFVMGGGVSHVIRSWLVSALPPLGYSRFPSSDYRGLLAFGLILLAAGILDDYQQQKINGKITRIMVYISWLAVMYISGNYIATETSEWFIVIGLSILVFATLRAMDHQRTKAVWILIALELFSGMYFLRQTSTTWRFDVASDAFYQEVNHESPRSVLDIIEHPTDLRPACTTSNFYLDSWKGYLLGKYVCESHDSKTKPREIINASPVIDSYMRQAWGARVMTQEQLASCDPQKNISENIVTAPVHSLSVGLQKNVYQVNAPENFCFVENELIFPGWFGTIGDTQTPVQAQTYCGALRSWCLPKGDYQFTESYRTPWLREGAWVSLLALFIYIALVVRLRKSPSIPL